MTVKRPTFSGPDQAPLSASTPAATTATRRARNPHGQGARLRAELIEAADRILAETGDLETMSLRGVARAAGVAAPSIYLHFPDKYTLLHAVLDRRFAQMGAAIREAAMRATTPAEMLRAGCLAYCRFATEHPNAYRVLFGRRPAAPPRSAPEAPADLPPLGAGDDIGKADGRAVQRGWEGEVAPVPEQRPDGGPTPAPERLPGGEVTSAARAPGAPPIPVGAEAFGFLTEGIGACIAAGVASPADPFRTAIGVWTALHGIVSLRGSVNGFPWPPLDQQVDEVLRGLVGLDLSEAPHSRVAGPPDRPEGPVQ